jgi:UDP-N-acetylglucosamine--N-acetylmuramyl-(pentapeptide) pyrophosphoryl-undecaprenol N-acetylglucosamine transferase
LIFLLLGTEELPFGRAVDRALPLAVDEEMVVQHGHTPLRDGAEGVTWIQFMPYERVLELCREASAVVCHAGVGAIMTARSVGKTPLVIPRLARFGEAVDDHQLQISAEFAQRNLVVQLGEDDDVRDALRLAVASHEKRELNDSLRRAVALAVDGLAETAPSPVNASYGQLP